MLIAPDKFKGTLSAPAAAIAIAHGVRDVQATAVVSSVPVADGGEGTVDTLLDARGGARIFVTTVDPWGTPRRARAVVLSDSSACLETASDVRGDPMRADSEGVGRAIAHIADSFEVKRIIVAVGGTASSDGGTGLARAFGWRFLDRSGRDVPAGGEGLLHIRTISAPDSELGIDVVGLCDVDSPLTGPSGSARTFAPQKGAAPEQVDLLEQGLANLTAVVRGELGVDLNDVPHAGAGGGIGAGLLAFLRAELHSGFAFVAEAQGLERLISSVDVVITGEGRFDAQTLAGKAPAGVARLSHDLGVPCLGLFGEVDLPKRSALGAGFSDILALNEDVAEPARMSDPGEVLTMGARILLGRQPL